MKKTINRQDVKKEQKALAKLSGRIDELKRKYELRKRQIAFDKYPKEFQEYLTKRGLNPYENDVLDRVEYKTTVITEAEKSNIVDTKLNS